MRVLQSLVIPDLKALVIEPDLAPILRVEPRRHRLIRPDPSTAPVAPAAGPERKFNRVDMWETTILESESDELPNQFRSPCYVHCPPLSRPAVNFNRDSLPTSFATSAVENHVNIGVTGELPFSASSSAEHVAQ